MYNWFLNTHLRHLKEVMWHTALKPLWSNLEFFLFHSPVLQTVEFKKTWHLADRETRTNKTPPSCIKWRVVYLELGPFKCQDISWTLLYWFWPFLLSVTRIYGSAKTKVLDYSVSAPPPNLPGEDTSMSAWFQGVIIMNVWKMFG